MRKNKYLSRKHKVTKNRKAFSIKNNKFPRISIFLNFIILIIAVTISYSNFRLVKYQTKKEERPYLTIENERNVESVFFLNNENSNALFSYYNYDRLVVFRGSNSIKYYDDRLFLKIKNIGNSNAINIRISHYYIPESIGQELIKYNDFENVQVFGANYKKDKFLYSKKLTNMISESLYFKQMIKKEEVYSFLENTDQRIIYELEWFDITSINLLINVGTRFIFEPIPA